MLLRAISLALLLTCSVALAEDMKAPLNAKDLKWGPAPNVFPKGAQMAIVSGDPFKDGPYVVRLKAPRGYRVPAHNHPTTHIGMGDKFDEKKGMELTTGAYAEAPAKMNHYAWATSNTVVQIHGRAVRNHLCQSGGRSEQEVEARSLRRLDCADPMDQAVVGCAIEPSASAQPPRLRHRRR